MHQLSQQSNASQETYAALQECDGLRKQLSDAVELVGTTSAEREQLVHERDSLRQRVADQQRFSDEAVGLKQHLEEMALQLQAAQRERDLLQQQQQQQQQQHQQQAEADLT